MAATTLSALTSIDVAGLEITSVNQFIGASPRTGTDVHLVFVGLVGPGVVELGHFGVLFARRVLHEQGLSCIKRCEIIDVMIHFFWKDVY